MIVINSASIEIEVNNKCIKDGLDKIINEV